MVQTDRSLAGQDLRLTATLPGGVRVDASVPGGRQWRVGFDMAKVPASTTAVVNITLAVPSSGGWGPTVVLLVKQRRFSRHPPPPQDSAITTFQVDHEMVRSR